jgi:hypothetical protein
MFRRQFRSHSQLYGIGIATILCRETKEINALSLETGSTSKFWQTGNKREICENDERRLWWRIHRFNNNHRWLRELPTEF